LKRVISEGIIYKLIKYSDDSAIAICFLRDFGKTKIFINKAFSKKRGVNKFFPAEIDFLRKDESDLHKLYGIKYDTSKGYFLENPQIFLRLNIVFNIIDLLYHDDEPDEILYKYILNINEKNMTKWTVYTINYILKIQGLLKNYDVCGECGCSLEEIVLVNGDFLCEKCSGKNSFLNKTRTEILNKVFLPEYKSVKISKEDEIYIVKFLTKYVQTIIGKEIKGVDLLEELI